MEISFKSGSRVKGVTATVAHRELEKIRKKGSLTPEIVVQEARPVKAPLHAAFTWDDKEAGELYRRYEARKLIRAVVVRVEPTEEAKNQYVHVTQPGETGRYEAVEVVVQAPDLYASALQELQAKLNSALTAVRQLEEMAKNSADGDRLMRITLAVRAMETAAEAVKGLQ